MHPTEPAQDMQTGNPQVTIKYSLDRLCGCLLLVPALVFFIPITVAIKLEDGGPVFFRQKRPGLHGKPFYIWKFRTMIPRADDLLGDDQCVSGNISRVTKVGKLLRSTSLDELPQLFNIIKGEMSFIGPRPALYEAMERYTARQSQRFRMKPGITGLAQVNGRNLLKWSKRLEYDVWYVEHFSLWLDLKIMLKTVKVVLLREGIVLDRNPDQVDDLKKLEQ